MYILKWWLALFACHWPLFMAITSGIKWSLKCPVVPIGPKPSPPLALQSALYFLLAFSSSLWAELPFRPIAGSRDLFAARMDRAKVSFLSSFETRGPSTLPTFQTPPVITGYFWVAQFFYINSFLPGNSCQDLQWEVSDRVQSWPRTRHRPNQSVRREGA